MGRNGTSRGAGEGPETRAGAGVLLAHVQQVRPAHCDDQAMDGGITVGRVLTTQSEAEDWQHGQAMFVTSVCDGL